MGKKNLIWVAFACCVAFENSIETVVKNKKHSSSGNQFPFLFCHKAIILKNIFYSNETKVYLIDLHSKIYIVHNTQSTWLAKRWIVEYVC